MNRETPRLYSVSAPTRGVQVYQVEARTGREAIALVRAGQGEAVWFETVWEGVPSHVRLDRPSGDLRSDRARAALGDSQPTNGADR